MFLPQYQLPSFTPIQINRQNYTSVYPVSKPMSYKPNCVTGTLHKMKILFIFWYEEVFCTINSTMCNWAIVLYERTQNSYSSNSIHFAAIFCKYFGPHCRDEKLCAHCVQEPKVLAFPFAGFFQLLEGINGKLLFCWLTGHCLCPTEDVRYSQILQCQVDHTSVSDTAHHFVLLTFLCEKLMLENTKSELVKASSHNSKAHLDLTWGLWAVRLSNIKCTVCSYCLQSVVH